MTSQNKKKWWIYSRYVWGEYEYGNFCLGNA